MPSDAEGVRLRAEAVRLQMAHLRAVRTGDATAASSTVVEMQAVKATAALKRRNERPAGRAHVRRAWGS